MKKTSLLPILLSLLTSFFFYSTSTMASTAPKQIRTDTTKDTTLQSAHSAKDTSTHLTKRSCQLRWLRTPDLHAYCEKHNW